MQVGPLDRELVQRAKAGNEEAFGLLYKRHYHRVLRCTTRIMDNREDAEDVTQEAFIKAYDNLPSFREKSQFSTWIYRIAINLALMLKRRHNSIFARRM